MIPGLGENRGLPTFPVWYEFFQTGLFSEVNVSFNFLEYLEGHQEIPRTKVDRNKICLVFNTTLLAPNFPHGRENEEKKTAGAKRENGRVSVFVRLKSGTKLGNGSRQEIRSSDWDVASGSNDDDDS